MEDQRDYAEEAANRADMEAEAEAEYEHGLADPWGCCPDCARVADRIRQELSASKADMAIEWLFG